MEPQVEHIEFERVPPINPVPDAEAIPHAGDFEMDTRVRLRQFSDLPKDLEALRSQAKDNTPDPLLGRYVLVDKKNDERVISSFSLRRKLHALCKGHTVLTNLNLDAKHL